MVELEGVNVHASYGIDAPQVVRNLFLFSLLPLGGIALSLLIESPLWFWIFFSYCGLLFLSLFGTGSWMLYSTLLLKPRLVQRLIMDLKLQGNETLLDLGCGRGLLLMEAAKRLPRGKAYGIDLWSLKDQSGNCLEKTMLNAEANGIRDRIELQTADMRHLPFSENSFDAVVASLSFHNISDEKGRSEAIIEMLRVLKPGGQFALLDIRYGKQYAVCINQTGHAQAELSYRICRYCPPIRFIKGRKNAD